MHTLPIRNSASFIWSARLHPCTPGSYQPLAGQNVCFGCEPGSAQAETGALQCPLCEAGSAQPISAQLECPACAIGSFTNQAGSSVCTVCPDGETTKSTGSKKCIKEDAEKFDQSVKINPPLDAGHAKKKLSCSSTNNYDAFILALIMIIIRRLLVSRRQH